MRATTPRGAPTRKSYNKAFLGRTRQKPDAAFTGTEQITTTPIYLHGARAMKKPCRAERYPGGTFQIAATEISPTLESCRTAIAIDLVSPGRPPLVSPEESVLRRHVFTDALPHISVTLWDQQMMFDAIAKTVAPVT
jgi:hypothetical protein